MLMVPVDDQGGKKDSEIISHSTNSHTLSPSIAHGPEYIDKFSALKDHYLIDFPGMFDSKGSEIEVAIDMALQMIIKKSKSTKLGLLVPSNHFMPDTRNIIKNT